MTSETFWATWYAGFLGPDAYPNSDLRPGGHPPWWQEALAFQRALASDPEAPGRQRIAEAVRANWDEILQKGEPFASVALFALLPAERADRERAHQLAMREGRVTLTVASFLLAGPLPDVKPTIEGLVMAPQVREFLLLRSPAAWRIEAERDSWFDWFDELIVARCQNETDPQLREALVVFLVEQGGERERARLARIVAQEREPRLLRRLLAALSESLATQSWTRADAATLAQILITHPDPDVAAAARRLAGSPRDG